jgi:hypothetical protein
MSRLGGLTENIQQEFLTIRNRIDEDTRRLQRDASTIATEDPQTFFAFLQNNLVMLSTFVVGGIVFWKGVLPLLQNSVDQTLKYDAVVGEFVEENADIEAEGGATVDAEIEEEKSINPRNEEIIQNQEELKRQQEELRQQQIRIERENKEREKILLEQIDPEAAARRDLIQLFRQFDLCGLNCETSATRAITQNGGSAVKALQTYRHVYGIGDTEGLNMY